VARLEVLELRQRLLPLRDLRQSVGAECHLFEDLLLIQEMA
jgi:hypothetical protein